MTPKNPLLQMQKALRCQGEPMQRTTTASALDHPEQ